MINTIFWDNGLQLLYLYTIKTDIINTCITIRYKCVLKVFVCLLYIDLLIINADCLLVTNGEHKHITLELLESFIL